MEMTVRCPICAKPLTVTYVGNTALTNRCDTCHAGLRVRLDEENVKRQGQALDYLENALENHDLESSGPADEDDEDDD